MSILIRLVRREARTPIFESPPKVQILTGALGYLGAAEDDRGRWLAGFRQLVDGLEHPIQVVMRFVPGRGAPPPPAPQAADRELDLWFASWLRAQPTAQARSVTLVVASQDSPGLVAGLARVGVPVAGQVTEPERLGAGHETFDCYHDRDGLHRTWALDRLPGNGLEPGWLLKLVPARTEVTLSWHADPLPPGWAIQYLQRQLVHMRAERMVETAAGNSDPRLAGALPQAEDLQRQLAASREKAFNLSLYVTLTARTREALVAGSSAVENAGRSALASLRRCYFRMEDGRLSTLPLGLDRLAARRIVNSTTVTTLFPWLDPDLQHPTGLVLGTSRATGAPVLLDPFDERVYANANIGVFGHSGAGKTHLLSSLLMSSLAAGVQAFVIDPEHEYGVLARRLGGVRVDLQLGSGQALNVLELRPPPSAELSEAWVGPAVADAVDLLAIITGGMDEPERALAEMAIRSAYAEERQPVLRDVACRLPEQSRVAQVLSRWVQGSLGAIFSAHTNIDLDADLVVFGMRELREELVGPVHFLLAEALWSRIKTRGRRRLLVVDELGLLFEDPTIRRFVVSLARRIRKYDGALIFATQNPGDLLSTEAGAVVATNPATHFFGAQRPGEALKLQRVFQLSDAQRMGLESARRGEFLLAAGSERLPLLVRTSPRQAEILGESRRSLPP